MTRDDECEFTFFEKMWASIAMLVTAVAGGFVFAVTVFH